MATQQRVPLENARNQLGVVWFAGGGAVFLILATQSILGKYVDQLQDVWSWFVPTVVPTLALMLGVFGAGALQEDQDQRTVKAFFCRLSKWLSVFYLVVLLLTILAEPFSSLKGMKLFATSTYWLTPLQSLVVAAITVLFTSQDKTKQEPPSDGA